MTASQSRDTDPGRRIVVIDDDPTGCQTVANIPVITRWDEEDLRWLLTRDRPMGFVLTNSRAMQADEASRINREIVGRLLTLGEELGVRVSFVSRSDSTLRGHFTAEVSAICRTAAAAGKPADLVLLAPAFFEAGRVTHGDVHYVLQDGVETPVAETAYAADATFGFAESNLADWVRARLGATEVEIVSLPLSLLRDGGAGATADMMRGLLANTEREFPPVVVVNATRQDDYDVAARAVGTLEGEGATVVTRCGPSYVASRLGEPVPEPVRSLAEASAGASHGLVVVGSHVPISSAQLAALVQQLQPLVVELDPVAIVGPLRGQHLAEATAKVVDGLRSGDVVLATARLLLSSDDPRASLDIAAAVSTAVDEVVTDVLARCRPTWIVAKGGITSANMVTNVLALRRGWIVGQMQRGLLPVWRDDDDSAHKPPCVIFPGNVGTSQSLVDVVRSLTKDRRARISH